MKRFINAHKKALAALAGVAIVAGSGIGAYAYWTSSGTGTGAGSTGTNSSFVIASPSVTTNTLVPDVAIGTGHIQTATYTVTNPSGAGVQQLNSVVIKVANADGSVWTSGNCSADDFSVGGEAVGASDTDTAGTPNLPALLNPGDVYSDSVTVQMINDSTENQNDCKSIAVPLYISAS